LYVFIFGGGSRVKLLAVHIWKCSGRRTRTVVDRYPFLPKKFDFKYTLPSIFVERYSPNWIIIRYVCTQFLIIQIMLWLSYPLKRRVRQWIILNTYIVVIFRMDGLFYKRFELESDFQNTTGLNLSNLNRKKNSHFYSCWSVMYTYGFAPSWK